MTECELQQEFSYRICRLILWLFTQEYGVTFGEAFRPPETAALYAKEGKGICESNHTQRLAIDLNLFRGGVYLTSVDDYRLAGEAWKAMASQGIVCAWGGDFSKPDADHFSFEWHGVK